MNPVVLKAILGFAWTALKPIFERKVNRILFQEAVPLVREIIATIDQKDLSPAKKRQAVFSELIKALKSSAVIATIPELTGGRFDGFKSILNLIIEMEYNKLKMEKTNAVASEQPPV